MTIGAVNFVSIMLYRTLVHFTKFEKFFTQAEKKSFPNSKFIQINNKNYHKLTQHSALKRNIYKLQLIPWAIKSKDNNPITNVDYNQVRHHIKYHSTTQDIYSMYLSFLSEDLQNMVGYRAPSDDHYQTILDFNDIQYSDLKSKRVVQSTVENVQPTVNV